MRKIFFETMSSFKIRCIRVSANHTYKMWTWDYKFVYIYIPIYIYVLENSLIGNEEENRNVLFVLCFFK